MDPAIDASVAEVRARWERLRGGRGSPSRVYAIPRPHGPKSSFSPEKPNAKGRTKVGSRGSIATTTPIDNIKKGNRSDLRSPTLSSLSPSTGPSTRVIHRPGSLPIPAETHHLHNSVDEIKQSTVELKRQVLALRRGVRVLDDRPTYRGGVSPERGTERGTSNSPKTNVHKNKAVADAGSTHRIEELARPFRVAERPSKPVDSPPPTAFLSTKIHEPTAGVKGIWDEIEEEQGPHWRAMHERYKKRFAINRT